MLFNSFLHKKHKNTLLYKELLNKIEEVQKLIQSQEVPNVVANKHCKKCAYYEYCYI